jgi:uncharacterized protein
MNLEEKLRQLRRAAEKSSADRELERQLRWLRRRTSRGTGTLASAGLASAGSVERPLPAQRVACGIEHYVEGRLEQNAIGEYFVAGQTLPFGRPYGKMRVGDVSAADLRALELFLEDNALPDASELVYLDTETTGLAGGTGTCAFLIGLGMIEGADFVVRQFFLRDYPDEKAILATLAQQLAGYKGLVTFNGKTFDVPLLETRYALARQRSPFGRMVHLDLLHPARRLWKLRLESCHLTNLEKEVLGITRRGDVPGSEIPGIYFDYLRTGDARGLQPVFYHNALDIITLAALTAELARLIGAELSSGHDYSPTERVHGLDLFSLSRIFERAGDTERSVSVCHRALDSGLPGPFEPLALWHLATQHKRRREYDQAVEIWEEIARRQGEWFVEALEQLAIHAEHRRRDAGAAIQFTERALAWLDEDARAQPVNEIGMWNSLGAQERRTDVERFTYRLERLKRKAVRSNATAALPLPVTGFQGSN